LFTKQSKLEAREEREKERGEREERERRHRPDEKNFIFYEKKKKTMQKKTIKQ